MSNYTSVPEPNLTPEGLLAAVQALKQVAEQLTGQVGGGGQALTADDQPDLHSVAETGDYTQLHNLPDFADIALSGDWADLSGTPTTRAGYGITDAEAYGAYNNVTYNNSTNSMTLQASDVGTLFQAAGVGGDMTVTVPSGVFSFAARIDLMRNPVDGTGEMALVAGSGVTILSADSKLRLNKVFSGASLTYLGGSSPEFWWLVGELKT